MQRILYAIAAALLLAALVVPAAVAGDGRAPAEDGPSPTAEPPAEATPTPFDGNGEIVMDPTFITATPSPAGAVAGATGRPAVTPPATDTRHATTTSGTGLRVLLVLGVGGSFLALLAGRGPAARRR